jgi:hypoxanthine phosphoribosyltransferase
MHIKTFLFFKNLALAAIDWFIFSDFFLEAYIYVSGQIDIILDSGKTMKKLITAPKLKKRVKELGKEISAHYKNNEIVILCILKGGFIFAADLIREIKSEPIIDFIEASSYGDGKESSGAVLIKKDVGINIKGKKVLIVEDIIDSGFSLNYLVNYLKKKKPASVEVCSLTCKT